MNATELTALLVFSSAMSFSPGPNTMLSTALAANRGLKPALWFGVSVLCGWTVLLLACGLGLGALIVGTPVLGQAVKVTGVVYLLWLAYKLSGSGTLAQADQGRMSITFWSGVGLQFLNIKAWMLALTITAGWVVNANGAPASNPLQRLAIICVIMAAFALASNFGYALIGSLLRELLSKGRRLLWFNRAMALILAATAAWMGAR